MSENYGLLSVLPPLLAIGLAIGTKQVYLSLMAGIWLGWTTLNGWNPLAGFVDAGARHGSLARGLGKSSAA